MDKTLKIFLLHEMTASYYSFDIIKRLWFLSSKWTINGVQNDYRLQLNLTYLEVNVSVGITSVS